jgi:hypothetical protein
MRARSAGYKVMLDTSIKIGHIGRYIYEWEDYVRKTGQVKPNCTQFSYQSTPTEDPDPCDDPSEEADLNLPPIGSSFSVCAKNPVTSGKA